MPSTPNWYPRQLEFAQTPFQNTRERNASRTRGADKPESQAKARRLCKERLLLDSSAKLSLPVSTTIVHPPLSSCRFLTALTANKVVDSVSQSYTVNPDAMSPPSSVEAASGRHLNLTHNPNLNPSLSTRVHPWLLQPSAFSLRPFPNCAYLRLIAPNNGFEKNVLKTEITVSIRTLQFCPELSGKSTYPPRRQLLISGQNPDSCPDSRLSPTERIR